MLTQTVTITQNSTPNIIIGRRSTYETQQVIFDVSWLIQTYGEGTAELLIKRPKDASAYPVVATLDGNTLTWTVSETDTQDKGHGECEIYWYVNGGLAKSCICGITILRDIGDTTETAPDPYETWVDELARLGAETLANAQAAEQSANNAAQSASEADNSAAAALESEENALNSENAAKASEQAAAASEQGAEQSATEAAQSASAAESSANDAQESADNASASADRAEQAAASIEGDTERAEAAAQTAQGAATSAQGSASVASTKATEAAGSAATAEQAANTATQKAADASASATAAAGSASSASASATAAGNAQTAAETAQGKAEDAQETAETAAQSIEDSAAQIDENTADILNLKSALNTKAGILRDTVSGSVASFVPDATIDNLLGLSVALESIQDLHGYDSPWPAGGGKNKFGCADGTYAIGSTRTATVANGVWTYKVDTAVTSSVFLPEATVATMAIPALQPGTYTFSLASNVEESSVIASAVLNLADGQAIANGGTFTINESTAIVSIATTTSGWYDAGTYTCNIQIENGTLVTAWTPYSNICPISGRASATVTRTGKNLAPFLTDSLTAELDMNGNANWCDGWKVPDRTKTYSYTVYIDNRNAVDKSRATIWLKGEDGVSFTDGTARGGNEIAAGGVGYSTVTVDMSTVPNTYYLVPGLTLKKNGIASNPLLELGSSPSAYSPYAGNTYTIQLGDTVYGGTLDVTNGTLTVDRAKTTVGALSWSLYNTAFYASIQMGTAERPISTQYKSEPSASSMGDASGWAGYSIRAHTSGIYIYIKDTRYSTAPDFKTAEADTEIVYELATPITIDLDPVQIATIANQTNNVWTDAGDVTVEFAADLKTYIDNKIAAAVAALS